jgi:hypothetical protein
MSELQIGIYYIAYIVCMLVVTYLFHGIMKFSSFSSNVKLNLFSIWPGLNASAQLCIAMHGNFIFWPSSAIWIKGNALVYWAAGAGFFLPNVAIWLALKHWGSLATEDKEGNNNDENDKT